MARKRSIADIHQIKQDLHEQSCCATRLKTFKLRTVKMLREQAAPWRASAQPWQKIQAFWEVYCEIRCGGLLQTFVMSWLTRS